ncbi:MAG: FlgD immunoglobulin-like domain containing protein [Calditrichia bacterium]
MNKGLWLLLVLTLITPIFSNPVLTWHEVEFDAASRELQLLTQAGIIEVENQGDGHGWMTASDYEHFSGRFNFNILKSEKRVVKPLNLNAADSLGQVLEQHVLSFPVQTAIGLGYDGEYFYLADFENQEEYIHKLDPNNNFVVKKSFPAPAISFPYCWGITYNAGVLYIVNPLEDRIFKTDTSGASIGNFFTTGGALPAGLGYRDGILWNSDLGDLFAFPQIPEKMVKRDTTGVFKGSYTLAFTHNGVAAHDSAVFAGRNKNNGKLIVAYDPVTFTEKFSFPSPLDYPNGLAFDGQYLWISGNHSGQHYIVKVDVGVQPPQPPQVNWNNLTLLDNGKFNNRFNAAFDSEGNVHAVYATQVDIQSSTKEIMYATNKSGVWELRRITRDNLPDELPVIAVDQNDVVHVVWNGYVPLEDDIEIFYSNNLSGEFSPKLQITSKLADGIDGHAFPNFKMATDGTIHFTFSSYPSSGVQEIYYATHHQGITQTPVNVSNNAVGDYDPIILLDGQENPHVFWCYWGSRLYHVTPSGSSWIPEEITHMGWTRPSAALDDQGYIHFAVTDGSMIKYGNNISGNFTVTDTLAQHAASCFYPQMVTDSTGNLHLTYHSFGDSTTTWPGNGEIFYTNSQLWSDGTFPQNISNLAGEQELYPGLAVKSFNTRVVGWALTGSTEDVFSNIRMATTLPDSGGFLSGKCRLSQQQHDFGFVTPADTAYWNFAIYNSGTRPLMVNDINWTPTAGGWEVFTDLAAPATLNPEDSLTVEVMAVMNVPTMDDTVAVAGMLQVNSDDPVDPQQTIQLTGQTEVVGIAAGNGTVVYTNRLLGNYPNPFNPVTTIAYTVAQKAPVKLDIYNIRGQLMQQLVNKTVSPGSYQVEWNGRSANGQALPSGIYFYRLKIGNNFTNVNRMILLK